MKTENSKRPKIDPEDFAEMELRFVRLAADLSSNDKGEADAAYAKLAARTYRYAGTLLRRDVVQNLIFFLIRRDRSAAILDMNVYQSVLQLAMPGKYSPLNASMRKGLALKLAFASKHGIKIDDLPNFMAKLPPVKQMKEELGIIPKAKQPKEAVKQGSTPALQPPRRSATARKKPNSIVRMRAAKLVKTRRRKSALSKLRSTEG